MTDRWDAVPRQLQLTTVAVLVLTALASGVGLLVDGFYHRDAAVLLPQSFGQDLLTLGLAVPVLAIALWFASRGSRRAYVVWLGTLGYVLYTYATYAIISQFNELFLVYVATFGLSLATFVGGLVRVDATDLKRAFGDRSVRPYVAFQALVAVLVGLLWLSEIVTATLANTVPSSIAGTGLPTNVVHVLDLGVVLPAFLLSAYLLARRRPWGYVLTGVLLVKVVTLGLAILSMTLFMLRAGETVPAPMLVVFGLLSVLSLVAVVGFVRAIGPDRTRPAERPAPGEQPDPR